MTRGRTRFPENSWKASSRIGWTIPRRIAIPPESPLEANLLAAKKLAEEAAEKLALAAVAESPARLTEESADLLFHLLVLLRMRELSLETVVAELEGRHRPAP